MTYSPQHWQEQWDKAGIFATPARNDDKPKAYVLEMFPYPSGQLHMGHVRNYTIGDVMARFLRAKGCDVFHPMGWDAFGLPAENAAIENGLHPRQWTQKNIDKLQAQMKACGWSFDWSSSVATCDESYMGAQQSLFIDMFNAGLVVRKSATVNWDPVDQTVLANEQVEDGRGWRSGALVERRAMDQWFIETAPFAQDLLDGLDGLTEWPEYVKTMQRNWIGKSSGVDITFPSKHGNIITYTTRPDTVRAAQFIAISPNHPIAQSLSETDDDIRAFIASCNKGSTKEADREKVKPQGQDCGFYAMSPITGDRLPVYIVNYVIDEHGPGAIFGVPAHDARDYAFWCEDQSKDAANLTVAFQPRTRREDDSLPYTQSEGEVCYINSVDGYAHTDIENAIHTATKFLIENAMGVGATRWRMRDWGVSRQRYWGCPIPIIHCPHCGIVAQSKDRLPVCLPEDVVFDGRGNPLAHHPTWSHTTCPKCQKEARRETDTMDTFMDSSWYFLRFLSNNAKNPIDIEKAKSWMGVDYYIGGVEHAILHLLYARLLTRILVSMGHLPKGYEEPFKKLFTQGMVTHQAYHTIDAQGRKHYHYPKEVKDSRLIATQEEVFTSTPIKMSKSKKNVVDPMDIIRDFGPDTARWFVLSDSPLEKNVEWTDAGAAAVHRRLEGFCTLARKIAAMNGEGEGCLKKQIAKAVQDVEQAYAGFAHNKAIAAINVLYQAIASSTAKKDQKHNALRIMAILMSPIAPHTSEEIWHIMGEKDLCANASWPMIDTAILEEGEIAITVQINAKKRAVIMMARHATQEEAMALAYRDDKISDILKDSSPKRIIYVPGRILNIII